MEYIPLLHHFTSKQYSRGDLLVREGQVCNHVFYIRRGLVKLFSTYNNREFIMQFFKENTFATVLDGFTYKIPSHFQLGVLEESEVLLIHRNKLEQLCNNNHAIETFLRKEIQYTAVRMHQRITDILENNATNSYNTFIKEHADLMQRISLGDLANYLGITQASLSKIRAKKI